VTTLRDIAIGIIHGRFPPLAEGQLAGERMKVCQECPQFQRLANQCRRCGCFLDLKTKLLEATCPDGKW
jgi:uncharacterized paraquat-inducible protein A